MELTPGGRRPEHREGPTASRGDGAAASREARAGASHEARAASHEARAGASHEARAASHEARAASHEARAASHEARAASHEARAAASHEARAASHEARAASHEARAASHEARAASHEARAASHEARAASHEAREALIRQLRAIVGARYVLTAPEDVIVYEQDGSILQAVPQVVVLPGSVEEVQAVVGAVRAAGVPIVPRGAGTGLAGGAVPADGGVVVTLTRLNRVSDVDLRSRTAAVEPGAVNLEVTKGIAPHGYFYAPDPSSQAACSVGGNLANNSGGPHTLAYGVTTNHALGVEVVLHDGSRVRLGGWVPDTPGYDLCGVFVGSEGTLGIVVEGIVRLMRARESVRTLLAVFDRMDDATQVVVEITGAGIVPAALEMMDQTTIEAVERGAPAGFPRDAEAVLLVEVEGVCEYTERALREVEAICRRAGAREVRVATSEAERQALWKGRKGAFGALGTLAPNYYVMDGVVPRSRLPETMRRVAEIGRRFGVRIANVFHAGDGNLHPNILFDMRRPGELERVIEAGAAILRACVDAGGSLTGEHGIGLEKKAYMRWVFTDSDLDAMARVRRAFDPTAGFNPGKVFPSPPACGEPRRAPARVPEGLWI